MNLLILNNIGTPDEPEAEAVGRYLKEFLMDEYVITAPLPIRYFLVHGLIVPRRKFASAEKYRKVWTHEGSPLLSLSKKFAQEVQKSLGEQYIVTLGMRYGKPSLESALKIAKNNPDIKKIILAPLYPQFAKATSYSAERQTRVLMADMDINIPLKVLPPFYNEKEFLIPATDDLKKGILAMPDYDHVLFSFHGLPESQVKKVTGCLTRPDCCSRVEACAMNCYRAQCLETANQIASSANVEKSKFSVGFQSRLGPTKWIGPSTIETLDRLSQKNVKKILVLTPSFVVDCLETLEEIQIEAKTHYESKVPGSQFKVLSCLNADPKWSRGFSELINRL
jgi:ferrochelatase